MTDGYRICTRCVMDTTDPDIVFDDNGVCNNCREFEQKLKVRILPGETGKRRLEAIIRRIKTAGKNRDYDCIIGVSGGVDSTYVAYKVKELGLRPLAVHLDNGWNSELAVSNIHNVLSKLDIDLYTHVLDWEEFKDLQLSFLKASTPDGEIPTDHAIVALLYQVAIEKKIKYIISGMNFRNEGMLPPSWAYGHLDWKYIKHVQKEFGTKTLRDFPHFGVLKFIYYNTIKGIKIISLLNYLDFNKKDAMELLKKQVGWQYYGGKHCESTYTAFYQSYILPEKFQIDKRKAHLTCLMISTGEITRSKALEEVKKPPLTNDEIDQNVDYLTKKFCISREFFRDIMISPVKSFKDYRSNYFFFKFFRNSLFYLRKLGISYR